MNKVIHYLSCAVFVLVSSFAPFANSPTAYADTLPPLGTPPTVSADPLPTVQINGVVWAQTIVGNTVYATGKFTKARPAGAAPGTNEVTRNNLLAYDITTGNLLGFNHSLNDEGQAITVSPDKKKLYVGGKFTSVNGHARNRIAAFDLPGGTLASNFTVGPTNGTVKALAATDSAVYVGGSFTTVTGGQSRSRLVAYNSSGGYTNWAPKANAIVLSLALTPDHTKVIIGGSFDKINNTTYYGLAAVQKDSPGNPLPFASQSSSYPIRNSDPAYSTTGINSITTNGTQMFITGFNNGNIERAGAFESRAAIRPSDGSIIWVNDCHGDSYGSIPIGEVLYSVTHAHGCDSAGGFPEVKPRVNWRVLAETIAVSGKNGPATYPYRSFEGLPRSSQLNWYPQLDIGTFTKMSQAAWSITGNSNYISVGGEFPKAEGKGQQGLVRYAIASLAPNKIGPSFSSFSVRASGVDGSGRQGLTIKAASDRDNVKLTYRIYRGTGTTPIHTFTMNSRYYVLPEYTSFVDTGLTPGATYHYRVTATDPFENTATSYSLVDDTRGIQYQGGGWISSQGRGQGDYSDGIHYTTNNGSSYTYSFNGTGFELVGHRNLHTGRIAVSIDGGAPVTVSTYNATHMGPQKSLYTRGGMTRGNHTVKVTKLDGTNMVIDGIRILP